MRIHHLEERMGDSIAFLRYAIEDQNQMTIWHIDVPPIAATHGHWGKLVEEAIQLASHDSSRLRIVCLLAKERLACHPELKERYDFQLEEAIPVRRLHSNL